MSRYVWTLEIVVEAEDTDDAYIAVQEELRWSLLGEPPYSIKTLIIEGTLMTQAPHGNIAKLYY